MLEGFCIGGGQRFMVHMLSSANRYSFAVLFFSLASATGVLVVANVTRSLRVHREANRQPKQGRGDEENAGDHAHGPLGGRPLPKVAARTTAR